MDEHCYWAVDCKTPNCGTRNMLKYIGIHEGQPIYFLPTEGPGWFDFECFVWHRLPYRPPDRFRINSDRPNSNHHSHQS